MAGRAHGSSISVEDWTLRATVGIGNGTDSRVNTAVQNPLLSSQFASLQSSTASSAYDVSWDATGFLEFLLDAEHVGQGNVSGFSRSTGSVHFIPSVDSILTIDAEYNYMLGNGDREAIMSIGAGLYPSQQSTLFSTFQIAIPIGGDPPNGTHSFHASAPLVAGEVYAFGYHLSVASFGGSPASLSHANGFFHATIQPVPEPATVFLIAAALPLLRRRRR